MFYSFSAEDGAYSLTTQGTILFIVLTALFILAIAFIRSKGSDPEKKPSLFSTRQLVFSAVSLALAFILSYVKLIHMPWGGSVTLCSMLFVVMIGYWYGPAIGIISAFAYGLLQFIQGGGGYILSPMQVAFDYVLAFAALGIGGFFLQKEKRTSDRLYRFGITSRYTSRHRRLPLLDGLYARQFPGKPCGCLSCPL